MRKTLVSARQRANALEALNVMWPSVPVDNVAPALRFWRDDHSCYGPNGSPHRGADCGTVACFGGWCALYPKFRDQGVTDSCSGAPMVVEGGRVVGAAAVAHFLFGDASLFEPINASGQHSPHTTRAGSHAIVTKRLKDLIARTKVAKGLP